MATEGLPSASPQVIDTTVPSSCARCNVGQKKDSRNLVVCIDGTSNNFGSNNTNVMKMFNMVHLEMTAQKQYAYYSSGIGTRPKSSYALGRVKEMVLDKFDAAVAWSIDKNIKEAYGWLVGKYQEGDQIYLFGFSRGAYQVRVLAGMIHEVGLIRTENQIAEAYNYYKDIRPGNPESKQIAREFKKTFSWKGLRTHFIGVWDTVSSVGLTRGDISLSITSSACHVRHALALDERRVKFLPEYFDETNSRTHEEESDYNPTSPGDGYEYARKHIDEWLLPLQNDDDSLIFGSKNGGPDIKEVWFAGSHSDVGGKDYPGKSQQPGNVSLLWMRREAIAHGLVLHPTDLVWMPDDLDSGISNSMSASWKIIEYLAIKHQVSYSGAGDDDQRYSMHRLEPRHIMPGQKLHASILYANAYKPQAMLGEGLEIPMIHSDFNEAELDDRFWETGLFDNTAARELLSRLDVHQGMVPIYLDRLLFMLRFNEGKRSVRNVHKWQDIFERIIENRNCTPLVRLVSIVAYYEASCDPGAGSESHSMPRNEPSQYAFNDAKECFRTILNAHKHRDCLRVAALLRSLTKHKILRDHILSEDILGTLVKLLDANIEQPGVSFMQTMDGLNSLLLCEDKDTRDTIMKKLEESCPNPGVSRLCKILEVEDPFHLTAALRVVMTLSRCPDARALCSKGKPRMRELARKHGQIIGSLATEILLTLHKPNQPESGQLNVCKPKVRENIASALVHMKFDVETTEGRDYLKELSLRYIFALGDDADLTVQKRDLIEELKKAVQKGNSRARTAATMTLLKLSKALIVREHFCEIGLLDVFVDQLQHKETAILAAYVLAVCMKRRDIEESMKDNDLLPKYIVGMLQEDYFDDTVGQVEGFQIFANFMQHDVLLRKVKGYDIVKVLETKLRTQRLREIRTSLVYLSIFRTFVNIDGWTRQLVENSLKYLQNTEWKVQKVGVTILSALAMTEYGRTAIKPCISRIIEMLIPQSQPIHPAVPGATPEQPIHVDEDIISSPSRPPSWMMGPACALRNLAQHKALRDITRKSIQYHSLKHLYLCTTLIQERDTPPWRVYTPDLTDVSDMIDKVIKAVDEELLSEEGLMTTGDTLPPHIQHWDRLGSLLHDRVMVTVLHALLGIPAVAMLAVATPIYLSAQAYGSIRRSLLSYRHKRALNNLRYSEVNLNFREAAGMMTDGNGMSDVEGSA